MDRPSDKEREAYRNAPLLDTGEDEPTPMTAIEALRKIKDECGKVCAEFEVCTHVACQSSYTAWAIADEALGNLPEQKPTINGVAVEDGELEA